MADSKFCAFCGAGWREMAECEDVRCDPQPQKDDIQRKMPVDPKMVEKAAKALCEYVHKDGDYGLRPDDVWRGEPRARKEFLAQAHAALAAVEADIRRAERERCAKVAERGNNATAPLMHREIAAAIRALPDTDEDKP